MVVVDAQQQAAYLNRAVQLEKALARAAEKLAVLPEDMPVCTGCASRPSALPRFITAIGQGAGIVVGQVRTPPGWPEGLPPPEVEGWESEAVLWLLDVGPSHFRLDSSCPRSRCCWPGG